MALTTTGIQNAREYQNRISIEGQKLADLNDILMFMNSNVEFEKFISGTSFGGETAEKWKKIVGLISGDLNQALANMNQATLKFLDRQEQYNSASVATSNTVSNHFTIVNEPIAGTPGPSYGNVNQGIGKLPVDGYVEGPVYTTPGFKPGDNVTDIYVS